MTSGEALIAGWLLLVLLVTAISVLVTRGQSREAGEPRATRRPKSG